MSSEFTITGLEELTEDFEKAVKSYPRKAKETLEDTGQDFRKRVKQIIKGGNGKKAAVFNKTGNLIKGLKVSKAEGAGVDMSVYFRSTAPHTHLIENGHNQVKQHTKKLKNGTKINLKDGGKVIGFVPGRLIVHQAREEYRVKMPQIMTDMLDEILRESDLN